MLPGCLLCLLGGCLLGHWASGSDLNCPPKEYPHDGRCCSRCAPGLKVRSDCTASRNTGCEQCEARHFQSSWTKERHCTPHRSCDHTDNFSDTVCVPCEHGSFSNISSTSEPCRPWTSCETLGLVQKVPGTNRLDVACEPGHGHGRGRFPVLISVMAIIAASLVGLILFCLYQKGLQQHRLKQGPERLDPVEPQPPAVVMCMEHDERQDFPVQETLLGRQPVAQEDGKESRISEQERL
ncbi:tumor necrosis factor receptor superfamily member 5 [Terrapene carolina triunguis]|uniref:tumor necrosis factor receptor superfamily member 5 n=1 Tax=Terrapene triunguis TaxID=2587831 RepID=UPI000E775698|nr:tumor necrosis factor receptor superfamily member 5 [Terrapene carolina triunguis]